MLKSTSIAVLGLFLLATPSLAGAVYHVESGQWNLDGYNGEGNDDGAGCYYTTQWTNGSFVEIGTFPPKNPGEDSYAYLMIKNINWDNSQYKKGYKFEGKIKLVHFKMNQYKMYDSEFEIIDDQVVLVHDLYASFLKDISGADGMMLFPGTKGEFKIGLDGTKALFDKWSNCMDTVINNLPAQQQAPEPQQQTAPKPEQNRLEQEL